MYGLGKYLAVEPNATTPFRATMRLYINETELADELGRSLWKERLTWCYWNGSHWDPVESELTEDGFLEAKTDHFSMWTIMEERKPNEMPTPSMEGVSSKTRAFNYTDTVPNQFRWSLEAREGTMLQFSNMAVYMNSTRGVQLELSAQNQVHQRLLKLEVDPSEALHLQMNLRTSQPEDVEPAMNNVGIYCEIEPNATVQLHAKLGLHIDPEAIKAQTGADVDPQRLTWAYWNGTN